MAEEYLAIWKSGSFDETTCAKVAEILRRDELCGRVIHCDKDDPDFGKGLLASDRWKRLVGLDIWA